MQDSIGTAGGGEGAPNAGGAMDDSSSDEEAETDQKNDKQQDGAGDGGEGVRARHWMPEPAETLPRQGRRGEGGGLQRAGDRDTDIISMLINIYGSKELFVTEYRSMLGQKLLVSAKFDLNKEKRNLELLKLRFGESVGNNPGRVTSLHSCEVTLGSGKERPKRFGIDNRGAP